MAAVASLITRSQARMTMTPTTTPARNMMRTSLIHWQTRARLAICAQRHDAHKSRAAARVMLGSLRLIWEMWEVTARAVHRLTQAAAVDGAMGRKASCRR